MVAARCSKWQRCSALRHDAGDLQWWGADHPGSRLLQGVKKSHGWRLRSRVFNNHELSYQTGYRNCNSAENVSVQTSCRQDDLLEVYQVLGVQTCSLSPSPSPSPPCPFPSSLLSLPFFLRCQASPHVELRKIPTGMQPAGKDFCTCNDGAERTTAHAGQVRIAKHMGLSQEVMKSLRISRVYTQSLNACGLLR